MVRPFKYGTADGSIFTTLKCSMCGKTFKTRDEKQSLRFMKIHLEKTHQALAGDTVEREETLEEMAQRNGVNSSKVKIVRH